MNDSSLSRSGRMIAFLRKYRVVIAVGVLMFLTGSASAAYVIQAHQKNAVAVNQTISRTVKPSPSPSPSIVIASPSLAAKSQPATAKPAVESPVGSPAVAQKSDPPVLSKPVVSTTNFQFTRLPFDLENVGAISPLGDLGSVSRSQTGSGHPYGNERHFIWHKQPLGRDLYNVYAPGPGTISRFKLTSAPPYGPQYQLYFRIDAKRTYYLAHINKLDPQLEAKIAKALGGQINESSAPQEMDNSIAIKAGDLLGQAGATAVNWDWGLIDNGYADGITDPSHFTGLEAGHSRSVYDLSSDDVKTQLRQLAGIWNSTDQTLKGRIGDPPLGTLGTDVKATLAGTWFQTYDFNPYPHLAIFSPYAYNTNKLQIMLEIPDLDLFGRYEADEIQALSGASLNPTTITPSSGIVGYYLKNGMEDGVLTVRVNADETITVEAIKGIQTLPDNFAFSGRAITLKR